MACRKSRCAPAIRSTSTRTRSASSSDRGLLSGSSGTKLSTARSVSLSRNTCLMNCSAEKQSTGSSSPQDPCGKRARICSQYWPASVRHLPAGSTMWVWTSKMNSSPASALPAAAGSKAASAGRRKAPPVLPRAANAWFRVRSVVAAPHSDWRNARRARPTRAACSVSRSAASAFARATVSVSGTGRNSPLEVGSILIGSPLELIMTYPCLARAHFRSSYRSAAADQAASGDPWQVYSWCPTPYIRCQPRSSGSGSRPRPVGGRGRRSRSRVEGVWRAGLDQRSARADRSDGRGWRAATGGRGSRPVGDRPGLRGGGERRAALPGDR